MHKPWREQVCPQRQFLTGCSKYFLVSGQMSERSTCEKVGVETQYDSHNQMYTYLLPRSRTLSGSGTKQPETGCPVRALYKHVTLGQRVWVQVQGRVTQIIFQFHNQMAGSRMDRLVLEPDKVLDWDKTYINILVPWLVLHRPPNLVGLCPCSLLPPLHAPVVLPSGHPQTR